MKHGGGSIIVWACFTASEPGRLAIIDGIMNSELYQQIKENVRTPVWEMNLKRKWVIQQDNNPKHTSHSIKEWLKKNKVNSSSSSPLLSLVQVPAKLAINLSIHTQHTYDNGVDRTGDRVFRKYSFLHEEREEEKKFLTPRLCSIWSTVWEQKKKHLSTKAHIP